MRVAKQDLATIGFLDCCYQACYRALTATALSHQACHPPGAQGEPDVVDCLHPGLFEPLPALVGLADMLKPHDLDAFQLEALVRGRLREGRVDQGRALLDLSHVPRASALLPLHCGDMAGCPATPHR